MRSARIIPFTIVLSFPAFFPLQPKGSMAHAATPTIEKTLRDAADSNPKSPLAVFVKAIERFTSDEVASDTAKGRLVPVFGRDKETGQVFDTLARIKGRNPVLVGEPGVGKTAIADGIAQIIQAGGVPNAPAFAEMKNAVVVEASAASISDLAESTSKNAQQNIMRNFLKGLKEAEMRLGRKIILYMDEMHSLQSAAFQVLKRSWVPVLEKEYNVKITDSAIRAAIRVAALQLAEKSVGEYGLTDKPLKLPQKNGQVIIEHPRPQKEIQAILEEAEKFAHQRIDENIGAIRLTAVRLVKNGFLTREGFDAVLSEAKKPGLPWQS